MARTGRDPFDALKGYQVIARFESEASRSTIRLGPRHRGRRSVFEGNVECRLDLAIKTREQKLE